jgi:tellurite resistance protein
MGKTFFEKQMEMSKMSKKSLTERVGEVVKSELEDLKIEKAELEKEIEDLKEDIDM